MMTARRVGATHSATPVACAGRATSGLDLDRGPPRPAGHPQLRAYYGKRAGRGPDAGPWTSSVLNTLLRRNLKVPPRPILLRRPARWFKGQWLVEELVEKRRLVMRLVPLRGGGRSGPLRDGCPYFSSLPLSSLGGGKSREQDLRGVPRLTEYSLNALSSSFYSN